MEGWGKRLDEQTDRELLVTAAEEIDRLHERQADLAEKVHGPQARRAPHLDRALSDYLRRRGLGGRVP